MSWSRVEIDNSLFESNYFHTLIQIFLKTKTVISKSNFMWNKATLITYEVYSEVLEISSCKFEENMQNDNSLINADKETEISLILL